jgi:hypothetical protein
MFPTKKTIVSHLKTGVQYAGALKGMWDTGRAIYGIAQTVAPYVAPLI